MVYWQKIIVVGILNARLGIALTTNLPNCRFLQPQATTTQHTSDSSRVGHRRTALHGSKRKNHDRHPKSSIPSKSSTSSSSALRLSPSNTTTTSHYYDPIMTTLLLDEAAFVQALQEQLADLQTLRDDDDAVAWTTYQKSLLPGNQQRQRLHHHHPYHMVSTIADSDTIEATGVTATTTNSRNDEIWTARLLLLGAAALYGTNFSLVKLLGDVMPVGVSSTLRFGMAAVACSPWLFMNPRKGSLSAAWLGFEVGLWNSIGYVTQAVGLDTTEASKSAFVCSLAVVIVPLLDFLAGKKLLAREWIGVLLAVVGVAFLELGGDTSIEGLSSGDLLSLVQPLAFGMGFWRMERAMHQYPTEASRMTAGQLLAVFLASAAYGLWSIDMPTLVSYPWVEWLTSPTMLFSLFWTGCITTALTVYMETLALKTLSAAETTLIFSTEPLWGTAFAALVMKEQLGVEAGVGAIFILMACLYSNLGIGGIVALLRNNGNERVHGDGDTAANASNKQSMLNMSQTFGQRWSSLCTSASANAFSTTIREVWFAVFYMEKVLRERLEKFNEKLR